MRDTIRIKGAREHNLNIHQSLRAMKSDSEYFKTRYDSYAAKYLAK